MELLAKLSSMGPVTSEVQLVDAEKQVDQLQNALVAMFEETPDSTPAEAGQTLKSSLMLVDGLAAAEAALSGNKIVSGDKVVNFLDLIVTAPGNGWEVAHELLKDEELSERIKASISATVGE